MRLNAPMTLAIGGRQRMNGTAVALAALGFTHWYSTAGSTGAASLDNRLGAGTAFLGVDATAEGTDATWTTVSGRPMLELGGGKKLSLPAGTVPAVTATTGACTVLVTSRATAAPAEFATLWSVRNTASPRKGIAMLHRTGSWRVDVLGDSASASRSAAAAFPTDGSIKTSGFTISSGVLRTYQEGAGMSVTASTTGVGTLPFGSPTIGCDSDGNAPIVAGFFEFLFAPSALDVAGCNAAAALLA